MERKSKNAVLLSARGLTKVFPGVIALDKVDFEVRMGEVNALVGENGAGKSTLIKIMAGFYEPDSGEILVNSEPLKSSPQAAHVAGIATIHQDHNLVPNMSVAENIALGAWKTKMGFVSKSAELQRAEKILAEIIPGLNPRKLAKRLTPAEGQLVEIARALSEDSKILVMDEPTSSLSPQEIDRLFLLVEKMKGDGIGIVFVSHWLEEVFRIADQITVLRDGKLVDSVPASSMDRQAVIHKMVGREVKEIKTSSQGTDRVVLEVKDLTKAGVLRDISFKVNAGEIVTVAGLEGAGRSEIADCIFGNEKYDSGEIRVNGHLIKKASPQSAIAAGIGYVPEDRHKQAMIPKLSVRKNLTLASIKRFTRSSWILADKENEIFDVISKKLRIKMASPGVKIATLSGGNQQKVILGRWLTLSPKLLILDEPTKGVDIGAKAEIGQIITELVANGTAILLISSELSEVLALSDRVIVIRSGLIVGELTGDAINQKTIMDYATSSL